MRTTAALLVAALALPGRALADAPPDCPTALAGSSWELIRTDGAIQALTLASPVDTANPQVEFVNITGITLTFTSLLGNTFTASSVVTFAGDVSPLQSQFAGACSETLRSGWVSTQPAGTQAVDAPRGGCHESWYWTLAGVCVLPARRSGVRRRARLIATTQFDSRTRGGLDWEPPQDWPSAPSCASPALQQHLGA